MSEPIKPYKIKYTQRDRDKMEKTLMETSKVYRWLREAGLSKNKIWKGVKIGRRDMVHETFRFPEKYITLEKLYLINELLPDKSFKEIVLNITPEYTKAWYELEDHELDQLKPKFSGYNGQTNK